jgi:hypothetical protein
VFCPSSAAGYSAGEAEGQARPWARAGPARNSAARGARARRPGRRPAEAAAARARAGLGTSLHESGEERRGWVSKPWAHDQRSRARRPDGAAGRTAAQLVAPPPGCPQDAGFRDGRAGDAGVSGGPERRPARPPRAQASLSRNTPRRRRAEGGPGGAARRRRVFGVWRPARGGARPPRQVRFLEPQRAPHPGLLLSLAHVDTRTDAITGNRQHRFQAG